MTRLDRQLAFVLELDKLKHVLRRTCTGDASVRRRENSAEHSWHFALMVPLLAEHANEPIDLLRTMKMALVHDVVEIDAGDTNCYDAAASLDKEAREQRAAQRIFALLPDDQRDEVMSLWEEFEARQTPESRFANAIDRFQAVLLNYHSQGHSWQEHGITSRQMLARNEPIGEGSAALWAHVQKLSDDAVRAGMLNPGHP